MEERGGRERTREMATWEGLGPVLLAFKTEEWSMDQRMQVASKSWKDKETDFLELLKEYNSANIFKIFFKCKHSFPSGSVVKNMPDNAGDTWDMRKIPWRRAWQPTPVVLAWRTPWTEESGGLLSIGSLRVRHDWVTEHACIVDLQCWVNFCHTAKWLSYTLYTFFLIFFFIMPADILIFAYWDDFGRLSSRTVLF